MILFLPVSRSRAGLVSALISSHVFPAFPMQIFLLAFFFFSRLPLSLEDGCKDPSFFLRGYFVGTHFRVLVSLLPYLWVASCSRFRYFCGPMALSAIRPCSLNMRPESSLHKIFLQLLSSIFLMTTRTCTLVRSFPLFLGISSGTLLVVLIVYLAFCYDCSVIWWVISFFVLFVRDDTNCLPEELLFFLYGDHT